jgi:hypothetical protein
VAPAGAVIPILAASSYVHGEGTPNDIRALDHDVVEDWQFEQESGQLPPDVSSSWRQGMRLVFVAGPYRARAEWDVIQNIRRAEELALKAWLLGVAVLCPHKNTAGFGGAAPDELWLEGGLEMVRRSDAVLCTSDWESSAGARAEVLLANQLGIPVFSTLLELRAWVESQGSENVGGTTGNG